jgi:formamidopyrimidine-DNA glycosylase
VPELPEVETTLRGLKAHLINQAIDDVIVRQYRLRWPIPINFIKKINQQRIHELSRRGKYLLIHLDKGTVIIHLGMSGSLHILTQAIPAKKHDHVDIILANQKIMRYTDPRRFGAMLWTEDNSLEHPLLKSLGVEPLDCHFTSEYLLEKAERHRVAIKSFIMDSKVVVGVGNIYATEALFLANIHPATPACFLTEIQCERLVRSIKKILNSAIKQGGTTLKDFINSEGKPGYFSQKLKVYGRAGQACVKCAAELKFMKIGQRSTVFCLQCQPAII